MICYEMTATYTLKDIHEIFGEDVDEEICLKEQPFLSDKKSKEWNESIDNFNDELAECEILDEIPVYIADGKPGKFEVIAMPTESWENICEEVKAGLEKSIIYIENVRISGLKEVGIKYAARKLRLGGRKKMLDYIDDVSYLDLDFFYSKYYKVKEKLYTGQKPTLDESIRKAGQIMADHTLIEELQRIYSDENEKKYYGNPVHYCLEVTDPESAERIVEILVPALFANNRVPSCRVEYLYDVDPECYSCDDLKPVFKNAQGATVVIDTRGPQHSDRNYVSDYTGVVNVIDDLAWKYGLHTLCIFVRDSKEPGFSLEMIDKVQDTIDIVDIREGEADYQKAKQFLAEIAKGKNVDIDMDEARELMPRRDAYYIGEIYDIFKRYYGNGLKTSAYRSYHNCNIIHVDKRNRHRKPYERLQQMVGLDQVKKLVDQMIAYGKMKKIRKGFGMDADETSMHMIFSGNPGTAKTTVARLIAQILKDEDILRSGAFVEVGRKNLVAKYVGWTAKAVVKYFRQAKGGILFIDEAYSLIDNESGSFGDEAINTIVQEMENHRNDVIVIFAGYPDKMKEFMDRNEGLKSRIAFHLDFPDYTPDELWQILLLQAKDRGYILDEGVKEKCIRIFDRAVTNDNFGNGRFARSLFEQAVMNQSKRLYMEDDNDDFSQQDVSHLTADDFDASFAAEQYRDSHVEIGFRIGA